MTPIVKIIFGAVLLLVGLISPFVLFIFLMTSGGAEPFIVPGTLDLHITEPGTYYLWNDYKVFLNDRTHNNEAELPAGMELALINIDGKVKQELHTGSPIQSQRGNDRSISIGYFELERGSYQLSVLGNFPERVMSFGKWKLDGMLWKLIALGLAAAAACIIGLVLIIRAIVQLSNTSNNRRPG